MFSGIDFDNVLVTPVLSEVNSRSEVDISVKLGEYLKLSFPVIASPMKGIVNASFAKLLSELGGIAILHRFYDTEQEWFNELGSMFDYRFGASVGLEEPLWEKVLDLQPDILCVDLANAYTKSVALFCEKIKNKITKVGYRTLLMSGNVATYSGAENLKNYGVDMIRVGIGSGGLCSTRNITGIGVPQITALSDCSLIDATIVADGGIKNSGDFVKAIVAGADVAMLGSLFGQAYESDNDGTIYGMASRKLQEMRYTQIKSVEGIEKVVDKKYSLAQFVEEFSWGIKSAGTYLNARSLDDIRKNGIFVGTGRGSIKSL